MDYQKITDSFDTPACVISVRKQKNREYGDLRIVAANKAYVDHIGLFSGKAKKHQTRFEPGRLYTEYQIPDRNFEVYCYRAAVEKKCLHSYIQLERYDSWFNMFYLPLSQNDNDTYYCTMIIIVNFLDDISTCDWLL